MKFLLACMSIIGVLNFNQSYSQEQPKQFQIIEEQHLNIEVLSWYPRIFVIHNFLSEAECDHLRYLAEPYLIRSTVVDEHSSQGKINSERTSRGMFMPLNHQDSVLRDIERRISLITLIPEENGESIQVLHYKEGGEYRPHYDYFDPSTIGGAAHLNRGGQRVASFLMYLNTPEEGGETVFPVANIKVTPEKGKALLFYSCTLDGKEDPLTLHGGAPVIKGEKWLATRWLRQFNFK